MSLPLISVVMPAHNRATTIGAAVSSLLLQTYPKWELIVVDDGSTDSTPAVANATGDPRITVVSQSQMGPAGARNHGLRRARGDLIGFLDSDDLVFDEYLDRLHAVWSGRGRAIATSNAYYLYGDGVRRSRTRHFRGIPKAPNQRLLLLGSNFVSPMSIFPRSLLDAVGPMREDLDRAEDWEFWLRAVYAGYDVFLQPKPMALLRRSAITQTSDRERVRYYEDIVVALMAGRSDLRPQERAFLDRRLALGPPSELLERADAELTGGRYRNAASLYRAAASLCPHEPKVVAKARLMGVAPWMAGPWLRRRAGHVASYFGQESGRGAS